MTQSRHRRPAKSRKQLKVQTGSKEGKKTPLRNGKEVDAEQAFLPFLLMLGGLWGANRLRRGAGGGGMGGFGNFGGKQGFGMSPWFGGGPGAGENRSADPGGKGSAGGSRGFSGFPGMGGDPGSGGFPGMGGGTGSGGFPGMGGFPGSEGLGGLGNMFGMGRSNSSQGNQSSGPMGAGRWPFFF